MRLRQSTLLRRALTVSVVMAVIVTVGIFVNGGADAPAASAPPVNPHAWHVMSSESDAAHIQAQQVAALAGSEFRADCRGTHVAGDDPIVKFNQPGASHRHQFIGNSSANAASTEASLRVGATNCNPVVDKSPYWVPALYKNGVHVAPGERNHLLPGVDQSSDGGGLSAGLEDRGGQRLGHQPGPESVRTLELQPRRGVQSRLHELPGWYQVADLSGFPNLLERT